jgi:hypothetical protein
VAEVERRDLKGPWVRKARQDHRVRLELWARLDRLEPRVPLAPSDRPERRARRVQRVRLVRWGRQDLQAQLDLRGFLASRERLASPASKARPGRPARRAHRGL